jgi:sarcosine oxidase subunit beta
VAETFDVVVVGAGITGASTAYHLKTLGVGRVLLVERKGVAAGGTGRSAAIVRQHYSTPLMAHLAQASIAKFVAMEEELGRSGGYVASGYHFLVPSALLGAARTNVLMQQGLGIDTRFLEAGEIERIPWLDPDGVAAVIHEPAGGYADPVRTTEAYLAAFARFGEEVRLGVPCRGLLRDGDRIVGVRLNPGEIASGMVVNAAGPWARALAASAGLALELRAVREQDTIWQGRPGRPHPTTSISNAVDAIYLRPSGADRFVIGRGFPKDYEEVDPDDFSESADDDFVRDVQERALRRFPTLAGMSLVHAYTALYDVTPDWYPFVGPRAGLEGYADASGGSGHGFKIAPALGEALARWITTGAAPEDVARLSHDRIAAGQLFRGAYGGNRG